MTSQVSIHQRMSFSRDTRHLFGWAANCNGNGSATRHNNVASSNGNNKQEKVWYCIQFRKLCEICLTMPLIGLMACLIIALIFQFEHIQETACRVFNVVPSISAVTGISPGRYLWRIAIAFHLGPRLLVVAAYYHFLLSFASALSQEAAKSLGRLLNCCFYLQIVEIVGLCGISFIHNREHYPTHEKGFILYLASSHLSFLLVLKIYHVIWPQLDSQQRCSYYKKLFIFLFSFTCLFLMAYFYYRHIIHCDSMAFSIFAFVEYWVAVSNMGFYWTVVTDMPNEEIVVLKPAVGHVGHVLSSTAETELNSHIIANGHTTNKKDNDDLVDEAKKDQ